MLKKTEKILMEKVLPFVQVGISFYSKILGDFKRNLLVQNFSPSEIEGIIKEHIKLFKPKK